MSAPRADRERAASPIYRAGPSVLYRVLVGVLLLLLAASLLGGMLLALLVPERPHLLLAAVALVMLVLLGAGLCLLLRPSFRVTTRGVEMRGLLATRRIDWPDIAVVEIDRSLMNRGAVVIVTRDGQRATSALTGSRFALYRGESTFDHGQDLLQPARPARAAIDTHRRFLHGAL
ncbi:PH domain-containing protein [Brachybacterium sp. AOP43-C2-M15]|uniref:PH domain-containing protein n=1 Tax=Brachybacterium sp. AOP43-C2-M15 TaxID=3457661 RepID=UPI0040335017